MSSELQLEEVTSETIEITQTGIVVENVEEHRERIRQGVISLVLPEKRHLLLLNSGFDVARQVGMLIEMSEQSDSFQDTKDAWVEKTREDISHFLWEFLAREPVLPINVAIKDGQLIAPRYGNRKLEDTTNETWRNGASKRAVKKLSSRLAATLPNTLQVITSPMGWVGPSLEVTESQTYLYRRNENSSISGLTIRTSMSLPHHEELLRRLGSSTDSSTSQIARITEVSETVAAKADIGFKDVAEMIQEIMGTEIAWIDESTGKEVSFGEIFRKLNKIPEVNGAIEALINEFTDFANSNLREISRESLVGLAVELGRTVIRMQKAIEITDAEENLVPNYQAIVFLTHSMPQEEYVRESQVIQMMRGCAASNSSTQSIDPVFGPRNMAEGWHNGTCRICHSQTLVGPCRICSLCAKAL